MTGSPETPEVVSGRELHARLQGRQPQTQGPGLGKPAGSDHYRAFVGPPDYFDIVAAMAFNLLTVCGLREHHRMLDVGCGSLRMGRLLIPYLLPGRYFGLEPNTWLVEDGILNELGTDSLVVKQPNFVFSEELPEEMLDQRFDYALAQSIFTHCAVDQISQWLGQIERTLAPEGVLVATYFRGDEDYDGTGWIYPGCAFYRKQTIAELAEQAGLRLIELDWRHPRKQRWVAMFRPGFDADLLTHPLDWNRYVDSLPPG